MLRSLAFPLKNDPCRLPSKGGAPAALDLIGGQVDLAFLNVPAVLSQVRGGELHALAVASATRARALPETPTMAEAGYRDFAMGTAPAARSR